MENIPTRMIVVAGALRDSRGRWLMHKRPLAKHHGGLWEFPGGKVEPGETPANALIRELHEELAITISADDLAPAGFAYGAADDYQPDIVILLYNVDRWQGEPVAVEGEGIAWCTPDEIETLDRPPLDRALCRQLLHKFADRDCQAG